MLARIYIYIYIYWVEILFIYIVDKAQSQTMTHSLGAADKRSVRQTSDATRRVRRTLAAVAGQVSGGWAERILLCAASIATCSLRNTPVTPLVRANLSTVEKTRQLAPYSPLG